jgi:hypothetical protein
VGYLKVILAPVLLPCHMSNLKQLVMKLGQKYCQTKMLPHVRHIIITPHVNVTVANITQKSHQTNPTHDLDTRAVGGVVGL